MVLYKVETTDNLVVPRGMIERDEQRRGPEENFDTIDLVRR